MIGMQGDANVMLRNATNVNQAVQMIDYADACLACRPPRVHADVRRLLQACQSARSKTPARLSRRFYPAILFIFSPPADKSDNGVCETA